MPIVNKPWQVVGYFPFMPVLVSRHRFRDEALAACFKETAAGPHMGESYTVEYKSFEWEEEVDDVESDVTST